MKIVTRQEAIARGLNRYYSGMPCKAGHASERYTLNSACVQCTLDHTRRERKRYRDARDAA